MLLCRAYKSFASRLRVDLCDSKERVLLWNSEMYLKSTRALHSYSKTLSRLYFIHNRRDFVETCLHKLGNGAQCSTLTEIGNRS